jgi:hypothetical protein
MQLEIGGRDRKDATRFETAKQARRAVARRYERFAVIRNQLLDVCERVRSRIHAAAQAAERKTAALFAGPRDRFDRMLGLRPRSVERIENAERRDDTVRAVVGTAALDGVEMGTEEYRAAPLGRAAPGAAREEIPDHILREREARTMRPGHEEFACLEIGLRE